MASRLSGAWRSRAAVAVAVLALPLFAAGAAQAAIAGGNASKTKNLPDLVTAKITTNTSVQVCYDKAIAGTSPVFNQNSNQNGHSGGGYAWLDGYNSWSNELDPSSIKPDTNNADCFDMYFDATGGQLDLLQFTAVTVDSGAVQVAGAGGQYNVADSTTLIPSDLTKGTHNGTQGFTSGPDLSGTLVVAPGSGTPNTLDYVFDQTVDPSKLSGANGIGRFWIEDGNGDVCYANATDANDVANDGYSGTTVQVTFPNPTSSSPNTSHQCNVANAVRAGVDENGVFNVSSDEVGNAPQAQPIPGTAGSTPNLDLQSAKVTANSDAVTYTFDSTVGFTEGTNNASDFFVALANGEVLRGCSSQSPSDTTYPQTNQTCPTPTINGSSITVVIPGLHLYSEYGVQAGVEGYTGTTQTDGAAHDNTSGQPADNATVPVGGNAKAFARGYTTGPDVYAVAIDATHDVATLYFDQRVADYCGSDATDSPGSTPNGNPGASGTDPAIGGCTGPGGGYGPSPVVEAMDSAGNLLGTPNHITIPAYPNPGPEAISMTFTADVVNTTDPPTQLAVDPGPGANGSNYCSFATGLFWSDQYSDDQSEPTNTAAVPYDGCSVPQIVSVTGAASHMKAIHVAKKATHKKAKSHRRARHHKRARHHSKRA